MFIDGLDECDKIEIRSISEYFRQMTRASNKVGVALDICISRRHFPDIRLAHCPRIQLELHTRSDIDQFVSEKLSLYHFDEDEKQTRLELQRRVVQRSNGMFLWASIVIDMVLEERDSGNADCLDKLYRLPDELRGLYGQILSEVPNSQRKQSFDFFSGLS